MMAFKNLSRGAKSPLLMKHANLPTSQYLAKRNYFSFVDKVKDRFNKPWRHLQSFMEPDGINYQT
jgi:hypothetical protein